MSENLLQQPDVEPLRIIGIDEVEMLEALAHAGIGLGDVLRRHAIDAEVRNVSLRNFITLRYEVPTNEGSAPSIWPSATVVLYCSLIRASAVDARRNARRAYEIFEERGGLHGHDSDDSLQAERELGGE